MGTIKGLLTYNEDPANQENDVRLVSEGDATRIDIGFTPGLAFFFSDRWFAELSLGFLGYTHNNRTLAYSDGFDETSKNNRFVADFTAATIRLKLGYFF